MIRVRLKALAALALIVFVSALTPASARDVAACPGAKAAENVLDAFMAAFNARDMAAWEATYHFPHVRIASDVTVLEKPGEQGDDLFDRLAATGWHHSAWADRQIVQCGADKVHVAVRFVRYRADGSELSSFDSLYIVTQVGEKWGVRGRSSFAP